MNKTDNLYLQDILQAIENIKRFTTGLTFSQFESDDMRYFAVIHMLEIIGEAANKLSTNFLATHPNFPAKQAVEMRNILIHGYDEIDLQIVWQTIQTDLPDLKKHVIG